MLLDEATSALDNESEKHVQQSLNDLMRSKALTMVVIAHRLTTIRNADSIAVVSGGYVVEQGTHDCLLKLDGVYSGLFEAAGRAIR
jgi:ABC-type multidrug transport system fused ATPase/permease subunit